MAADESPPPCGEGLGRARLLASLHVRIAFVSAGAQPREPRESRRAHPPRRSAQCLSSRSRKSPPLAPPTWISAQSAASTSQTGFKTSIRAVSSVGGPRNKQRATRRPAASKRLDGEIGEIPHRVVHARNIPNRPATPARPYRACFRPVGSQWHGLDPSRPFERQDAYIADRLDSQRTLTTPRRAAGASRHREDQDRGLHCPERSHRRSAKGSALSHAASRSATSPRARWRRVPAPSPVPRASAKAAPRLRRKAVQHHPVGAEMEHLRRHASRRERGPSVRTPRRGGR